MLIFSNLRACFGRLYMAQAIKWSNVVRINLIAVVDLVKSYKRQPLTL